MSLLGMPGLWVGIILTKYGHAPRNIAAEKKGYNFFMTPENFVGEEYPSWGLLEEEFLNRWKFSIGHYYPNVEVAHYS